MKNKRTAFSLIELSIVILIIGILIAGVTQGSRLITQMKLSSARTISQSSDVNSIPDLILWLDAVKEASLTNTNNITDVADSDKIKSWQDRNSQAINISFTQATTTLMPSYVESGINNLPSLSFDGVDDNLSATDDRFNIVTNLTVFVVFRPINVATAGVGLITKQVTGSIGNPPYALLIDGSVNPLKNGAMVDDSSNTTTSLWAGTGTISSNQDTIGAFTLNSSDSTGGLKVYTNSILRATGAGRVPANINTALKIGQQKNGFATRFFNGYISEIIIYSRTLPTEERKAVENYLSKKWSIKLS